MSTAAIAAALIDVFEGSKLVAYQDPAGIWTIGKGHTGPDVTEGLVWTPEQAAAAFASDSAHLFTMVANSGSLLPAQQAAYVSFGYNCGASKLAVVLAGTDSISNPIHTTDRAGRVLSWLVTRRRLEAALADG